MCGEQKATYVGFIHLNVKCQFAPKADIMMIESLFQKKIFVFLGQRAGLAGNQ